MRSEPCIGLYRTGVTGAEYRQSLLCKYFEGCSH